MPQRNSLALRSSVLVCTGMRTKHLWRPLGLGRQPSGGLLRHLHHLTLDSLTHRHWDRRVDIHRGAGTESARPLPARGHLSVGLARRKVCAEHRSGRILAVVALQTVPPAELLPEVERHRDLAKRNAEANINKQRAEERGVVHRVQRTVRVQHIVLTGALAGAAEGALDASIGVVEAVEEAGAPQIRACNGGGVDDRIGAAAGLGGGDGGWVHLFLFLLLSGESVNVRVFVLRGGPL